MLGLWRHIDAAYIHQKVQVFGVLLVKRTSLFFSGTYVRPLCDETNLRRQRPISASFSEGSGFRHSFSRSYQASKLVELSAFGQVVRSKSGVVGYGE